MATAFSTSDDLSVDGAVASVQDGAMSRVGSKKSRKVPWERWSDERLLEMRFCDLGVTIAGSALEPRVARVQAELDQRRLKIKPLKTDDDK